MNKINSFSVRREVSDLGIKVVFLIIQGIDNNTSSEPLSKKINLFYKELVSTASFEALEKDPYVAGYRKLHQKIGVKDKSLIPSPESLIRLIFKYHSLKSINFIVDIYNYISVKNKISIGAHDLQYIHGYVRLDFTKGHESFIPLGRKSEMKINENEYCYIDDADNVLCRLECRQSDLTKMRDSTEDCLFILQGHSDIPEEKLLTTADELRELILLNTDDQLPHKYKSYML